MNAAPNPNVHHALKRFLTAAQDGTYESRLLVSFLLIWWDAEQYDGFVMTYVRILDPELVKVCAQLVSLLAFSCVDPGLFGFGVPFEAFASSWQHRV